MQIRERLEKWREYYRALPEKAQQELSDIISELKADEETKQKANVNVGRRAKASKKTPARSKR